MPKALCLQPVGKKALCMKLQGHSGRCDATPKLTKKLSGVAKKKLYKTMQTRGAQPYSRVPYQNRVARWNRAVVPYEFRNSKPSQGFENGYVIMVRPSEYFGNDEFDANVEIGKNAFVFYDNWDEYEAHPPETGWEVCKLDGKSARGTRRTPQSVDSGHYILRLPSTTSANKKQVVDGPPQGIRFFEYTSELEAHKVLWQLAYLVWKAEGIDYKEMPKNLELVLNHYSLADSSRLRKINAIGNQDRTICPLCLKSISIEEIQTLVKQTKGRETYDLTVTEVNLFHLESLKPGEYNHRPYSVGWGHYHCNTTARDMGVPATLDWMREILDRWEKQTVSS